MLVETVLRIRTGLQNSVYKAQPQFIRLKLVFIFFLLYLEQTSYAVEYKGQFRTGGYSSEVKLLNDQASLGNNNASIISNRLNMTIFQFNDKQDEISLDFRDRYDFFGRRDRELLELTEENTLEIRELAYRRPWQRHRLYFTAGRFVPKEAGLLTNDGGHVGYRLTREHRLGLFAGIADQSIVTPPTLQPTNKSFSGNQAGAYWVYDKNDVRSPTSIYMTNAVAQGPSFDLIELVDRVYFYHLSLLQLGANHRVSNHINFDLTPEAQLRQAYISYNYYSSQYRFTSYYNRVSPEENRVQKDIQDSLAPSTVDSIFLSLIHRLTPLFSLEYRAQLAQREADGKQQQILALGSRYLGLARGRLALGGLLGIRNNFQSNDQFLDLKLDYYQQKWSAHLEQGFANKNYEDNGPELFEIRSTAELAFYFGERLRGSAAFSQAKNEQAEITTVFLMIGYYFGTGSTSPTRNISPVFEGL